VTEKKVFSFLLFRLIRRLQVVFASLTLLFLVLSFCSQSFSVFPELASAHLYKGHYFVGPRVVLQHSVIDAAVKVMHEHLEEEYGEEGVFEALFEKKKNVFIIIWNWICV
jgi:hypothetical protein